MVVMVIVVVVVAVLLDLLVVARVLRAAVMKLGVKRVVRVRLVDDADNLEVGVVERMRELLKLATGLDELVGALGADEVTLRELGQERRVAFLESKVRKRAHVGGLGG